MTDLALTGETMADHKMFTTPVQLSDGLKRSDAKTWAVLLIVAVIAVVIVVAINLFVERKPVHWPTSPKTVPAPAAAPDDSNEPRTYEVAPPGAVPPPKSGTH